MYAGQDTLSTVEASPVPATCAGDSAIVGLDRGQ